MLLSHPDVAEAAAFPVRSELAEDEVMVAIVPHDGHSLTPAQMLGNTTQEAACLLSRCRAS